MKKALIIFLLVFIAGCASQSIRELDVDRCIELCKINGGKDKIFRNLHEPPLCYCKMVKNSESTSVDE